MPTYEYECQKCGHRLEKMQTMIEPALKKCPKCQKNSLKRMIGAGAGIIFKGSGFYQTDYKNKSSSVKEAKSCPSAKSDSPKCAGCPAAQK